MSSYLLSGGELSELAAQVGMCDVSAASIVRSKRGGSYEEFSDDLDAFRAE